MTFTPAQLEERRKHLGSSEIAAVCGLSPYRGPFDVWAEHVGLCEPFAGNEYTRWGERLEDDIADAYAATHPGVDIQTCETRQHSEHPWMAATPDRLILSSDDGRWLLECKAPSWRQLFRWGDEGTSNIPEEYLAQVLWQLYVLDLQRCDVAAFFGGACYREYSVMRGQCAELESAIIAEATRFWNEHVIPQKAPPVDGTGATLRYLANKYRDHNDEIRPSSAEAEVAAKRLRNLRRTRSATGKDIAVEENRLKAIIADSAGIDTSCGRIMWRRSKAGTRRFQVPREWEAE